MQHQGSWEHNQKGLQLRKSYDKKLGELLKTYRFIQAGHVFTRCLSDGIVQSIWYNYEPRSTTGVKYHLCFSVDSLYRRNVFGPDGDQPEMTEWHNVAECAVLKKGQQKQNAWEIDEEEQLRLLKEDVIPMLESMTSSNDLYEYRHQLELLEHNAVRLHVASDLYLALHLSMYDEALRCVTAAIQHRDNMKIHARKDMEIMGCAFEQIESRMKRLEQAIAPLREIQTLLQTNSFIQLDALLQAQYSINEGIYSSFQLRKQP